MAQKLTNKALVVLALLREGGERTCHEVAESVMAQTPCAACDGTGDGDDSRYGCRKCYGRGQAPFYYSKAYAALKQLRARGLVTRRHLVDEWGDETPTHVWRATEQDATSDDDALEVLWNAPAAER